MAMANLVLFLLGFADFLCAGAGFNLSGSHANYSHFKQVDRGVSTSCPGTDPAHCDCGWTHNGTRCGKDDASECFCRCCCQYESAGFECKWHHAPSPSPKPPSPSPSPPPPHHSPLTAVRIQGNHLVDADGNIVVLRGVSHSGSEYTCVHGHGIFEGTIDDKFVAGLKSWKNLNSVRLPLNEDCWLGINGVPSDSGGAAYQAEFKRVVNLLTSNHLAVLPDLHWTAAGNAKAGGQQPLPDRDHAPKMWKQVAETFKDNPLVIFELFNEPFLGYSKATEDDWICWSNGTRCPMANLHAFKLGEFLFQNHPR